MSGSIILLVYLRNLRFVFGVLRKVMAKKLVRILLSRKI